MTDRPRALANLETEVSDSAQRKAFDDDTPIVVMSGLNGQSKTVLMGRDLTIRFFPFLVGRIPRQRNAASQTPDLVIREAEPYRISHLHLSMERRGNRIFLVDRNSRYGSIVNNNLLGENIGGIAEIPLNPGDNEIILGGRNSPFIFKMKVVTDDRTSPLHDQVRFGDHIIPVATLYSRLCHQTSDILKSQRDDCHALLNKASALIDLFAPYPDTTHHLYYFSTSPDTFPDLIVAHSVNVAIYTVTLAYGLLYSPTDITKMGVAALLHDVGMYDIPAEIVEKKEKISDQEYEIVKTHPLSGCKKMVANHQDFQFVHRIIREHHERIDGKGYPAGISALSEITELIAMVDFFEAVTHYRPQRGPVTPHEGMKLLLELRHAVFSPNLLKTFIKEFSLFPVFSVVHLNTGEIGQVIRTDPNWPLRPTVRIFFKGDGNPPSDNKEIDLREDNNLYIRKDISDRIFIDRYFQL
jgi:HD-GYP domain-containing protein (c-di-GMP phosphodiesterase class II)